MTVRDLLKRVPEADYDKVMILSDGKGWCNIGKIEIGEASINIFNDTSGSPFSSDK